MIRVFKQMLNLKMDPPRLTYLKKDVCRIAVVKLTTKGRLGNVLLESNKDMTLTAKLCAVTKMSATRRTLFPRAKVQCLCYAFTICYSPSNHENHFN